MPADRIHITVPSHLGREAAEWAVSIAYRFAADFLDRPRGQAHLVGYVRGRWAAAAWWTKAGAVSVVVTDGSADAC